MCVYTKLTVADWTPDCDRTLQNPKDALSTDTSTDRFGAVLSQVAPGEDHARPIVFASKSLNKAQRNYPAYRLKFLALRLAVCDKFSRWLKGHVFTAWTDNNPLAHIHQA